MLGLSTHAWKVNFCKFTNETRNGLEDSSRHDGLKSVAAVTGACAGGGYELALACDRIVMVDDRSSTVSLPEVPLLGVLPGTGGLTRVTDKRKVRRDLADIFCTTSEGVRADRAKDWKLIDGHAKPQQFGAAGGHGSGGAARAVHPQRPAAGHRAHAGAGDASTSRATTTRWSTCRSTAPRASRRSRSTRPRPRSNPRPTPSWPPAPTGGR